MPTPTKGARLGGGPAHERLMLANLATQLFEHQSITTTVTKAKRVRPLAERMITFAKRGDLAARRRVMRIIRDKTVVHVLFTEIGPAMAEREGGYTRIVKIGPRKGDSAPMAVISLVMEPVKPAKKRATVKKETPAGDKPDAKDEAVKVEAKEADAEATAADKDAALALDEGAEAESEAEAGEASAPEASDEAEVKAEEPKVEEPVAETEPEAKPEPEAKAEEPKVEEPESEPEAEEPAAEPAAETKAEEPKAEEPAAKAETEDEAEAKAEDA